MADDAPAAAAAAGSGVSPAVPPQAKAQAAGRQKVLPCATKVTGQLPGVLSGRCQAVFFSRTGGAVAALAAVHALHTGTAANRTSTAVWTLRLLVATLEYGV